MNEQPANVSPQKRGKPAKVRLDALVATRFFDGDVDRARRSIMAGEVRVGGVVRDTPAVLIAESQPLEVRGSGPYVSRGGHKLAHALDAGGLDVRGMVAIDVGASTGGFSDVLLQRGVARLYAIDVAYGELAWKVRSDARVTVLERTNIRHLQTLPDGDLADLAVIDASFIGLAQVLPATLRLLKPASQIIALVKPQFEAQREEVSEGGVVRNSEVHRRVLQETIATAHALDLRVADLFVSPIRGPAGNVEFLIWLKRGAGSASTEIDSAIEGAIEGAIVRALESAERLT